LKLQREVRGSITHVAQLSTLPDCLSYKSELGGMIRQGEIITYMKKKKKKKKKKEQ
jgi:hypothetical protein